MYLIDKSVNPPATVRAIIEPVTISDLKKLTKKDYFFKWKDFSETELWKLVLRDNEDILGVMSLTYFPEEYRIEINLIASRINNVGPGKKYSRIAGCLIGWACQLAVGKHGNLACVSLKPKTRLIQHYQKTYGMLAAGSQLFLDGSELFSIIRTYIDYES